MFHCHVKSAFGLDFGYTNDPSALFCGLIDTKAKSIWVFHSDKYFYSKLKALHREKSSNAYRIASIRWLKSSMGLFILYPVFRSVSQTVIGEGGELAEVENLPNLCYRCRV